MCVRIYSFRVLAEPARHPTPSSPGPGSRVMPPSDPLPTFAPPSRSSPGAAMDPRSLRSLRRSSSYRRWSADDTDGCTRANAASKCADVTSGGAGVEDASARANVAMFPLSAATHASRTSDARSAPEKPPHRALAAMAPTSTSGAIGVLRVSVLRMAARPSGGGRGTYRSLSSLPGRNIAGSIMSGRLVAATTNVALRDSRPSISVKSWFTTRSLAWLPSPPRRGASESSSSKNKTHGDAARARAKSVRTARSLSPTYLLSSSGPLMEMKLACASLAVALATSVLPHPGGP